MDEHPREVIRNEGASAIETRVKSGEVVEIVVANKIEERLEKWLKQRLWVVTVLLSVPAFLGIKSYNDYRNAIKSSSKKITDSVDDLALKSHQLTRTGSELMEANEELRTQYRDRTKEARNISGQLAKLERQVLDLNQRGLAIDAESQRVVNNSMIDAVKKGNYEDVRLH